MVWVSERRPRKEDRVCVLRHCENRLDNGVLGSVTLVVNAPEGQPHRRYPEDRARPPVLLAPCPSRLALCAMAGAKIPTASGRLGFRVAAKDRQQLDMGSMTGSCPHRRAEREDAVVEMWRHDDDAPGKAVGMSDRHHDPTMIAALAGREQESRPWSWRAFVPAAARRRLSPLRRRFVEWRSRRPPNLGDLRRVTPIDSNWGYERGTPIDRVYVDRFIGAHARDIHGRVLEIAAPDYTNLFGTAVERSDVLMAKAGNPEATIVGDLTDAPHIESDTFDCAIVTQTLQFVYDVRAALATLERILVPGGVLLATAPGISKISPHEDEVYGEWWHFTGRSLRRLGEEAFGPDRVEVTTYGNVLTASGFLYGLAASDLGSHELDAHDRLFEVVVGLRAVKRTER